MSEYTDIVRAAFVRAYNPDAPIDFSDAHAALDAIEERIADRERTLVAEHNEARRRLEHADGMWEAADLRAERERNRAEAAEAERDRLLAALAPMKHALDVGDRDHWTEYMESRDWDALANALSGRGAA